MDYAAACRILYELPRFELQGATAISPGLQNMRALLKDLGDPHERYPIVHVAGTNGKGSVCSMLAAMLTASGRRTGLHTSPHLLSFTERMRVNGAEEEQDWVVAAVKRMLPSIRRVRPSFFEASTALAFLCFAERRVDIAIIEVGMGGRLDATNVVLPELAVITNVGIDHVAQLGATAPLIAREKAGIIKTGIPVVNGACQPDVRVVIEEVAASRNAPIVDVCTDPWGVTDSKDGLILATPSGPIGPVRLDLPGRHQRHNALVAAACARQILTAHGDERHIHRGLSHVRRLSGLRARCEIVSGNPLVVIDVSHNEDGIRAAMEFLDESVPRGNLPRVMLGLAADKDVPAILRVLASHRAIVMPVAIPGERGLPPDQLGKMAREAGLKIVEIESALDGWRQWKEQAGERDRFLITGSHYLVGTLPEEIFPRRAASAA